MQIAKLCATLVEHVLSLGYKQHADLSHICVRNLTQAELAEIESDLTAKRSQLDTVANLLLSKRKELSLEEQRKAISDEGGSRVE